MLNRLAQVLRNPRYRVALFYAATLILGSILSGFISNSLSQVSKLPGPLLFIIFLVGIVIVGFGVVFWQSHVEHPNQSGSHTSDAPVRQDSQQISSANKLEKLTAATVPFSNESTLPISQSRQEPSSPSHPIRPAIPPLVEFDDNETPFINDPLPAKPHHESEPTVEEKISSLPLLVPKAFLSRELPDRPTMLYWSPDGTFLACMFYEHVPLLVSENDSLELPVQSIVDAMSWSPDSRILAWSSMGTINFWDITTQSECWSPLRVSGQSISAFDWSIRGQLAVWTSNQIQLFVIPAYGSTSSPTLTQILSMENMHCDRVGLLRWSPEGSLLGAAATNGNGTLSCWHIDKSIRQSLSCDLQVRSLTWSTNSGSPLLAVAFKDHQLTKDQRAVGRIAIWDVDKSLEPEISQELPVIPSMLSISQETRLAIASREHDLLFSHLDNLIPSERFQARYLVAWSSTSSKIATMDSRTKTTLIILSV